MPPRVEFRFLADSPFRHKSIIQKRAIEAIRVSNGRGIIVIPCGGGKTAVGAEAAMALAAQSPDSGTKQHVLWLCFESVGVLQAAEDLRKHTTLQPNQVCVQTGKHKDEPDNHFCFMVTTYAMFSSGVTGRSEKARRVSRYVHETAFNVIILDEVHHACAPTYMPFLKELMKKAEHVVGLTATLFRNEQTAKETREEHGKRVFGWIGPVLYHCTARESEEAGLVAKIRRAEIKVDLTREFKLAHESSLGSSANRNSRRFYLASLNPQKLNALVFICRMHERMDHAGIVFSTHLLTAKVLRDVLGEGWEVLAGSNAHGVEEKHTADANNKIVKRFNAGQLRGIISTAVGESSLDLHCESFRYVVVLDADGGSASAAQKLGRAARTPRVVSEPGESSASLRKRRLRKRKSAAYYEINTRRTADVSAAKRRAVEFEVEGYPDKTSISYETILAEAKAEEVELPYTTLTGEMQLMKEILSYDTLKNTFAVAKAAEAAEKAPQKAKIRMHNEAAHNHGHSKIVRELHKMRSKKLSKQQGGVDARASIAKERVLNSARLSDDAVRLFSSLTLPSSVLVQLKIGQQVLLAPSDDDEDEASALR